MEMLDIDHLTENQKKELSSLIDNYNDVFAIDMNSIGRTHLVALGAELRADADLEALRTKFQPTPYHLKSEMKKIISSMLHARLIKKNPPVVRLLTPVK